MMQAILAAQAALIAFALLLSEPASIADESRRDAQRIEKRHVPTEPARLRCRLYFGCVHD
jgi:hypothetical protein